MEILLFVAQLLVGGVLAMSGLMKLAGPGEFVQAVRKHDLLPARLEAPAAIVIITLEPAVAGLLLSGELARFGAALAALLLLLFIAVVAVNLRRGLDLDCGCFGLLWREQIGPPTLVRDAVLLAGALLVATAGPGLLPFRIAARANAPADLLPAAAVSLIVATAAGLAGAALRANRAWQPPPPAPENLPPPHPA